MQAEESVSATTIDMSTLLGLDVLCDHRLAFIGCDREILLDTGSLFCRRIGWWPRSSWRSQVDEAVIEACCELKNAGYRIAIDGFAADDPRQAIVHLADYLKVDLKQGGWEEIPELVGPDHWKHPFWSPPTLSPGRISTLRGARASSFFRDSSSASPNRCARGRRRPTASSISACCRR